MGRDEEGREVEVVPNTQHPAPSTQCTKHPTYQPKKAITNAVGASDHRIGEHVLGVRVPVQELPIARIHRHAAARVGEH